ncbi:MAG: hypothetical protein HUU15_11910 [Candidatus Brocadiae bacterium]|nr:hypothetical protein [Candidatus Brocadiia bacterium]
MPQLPHDRRPAARLLTAAALTVAACGAGCGPPDTSRGIMNPRKEKIYQGAMGACEADTAASVSMIGPMGAPRSHPLRLKSPCATRADLEAVMGPADISEPARVSYVIEGGMGKEAEEDNLRLVWQEPDSRWESYGPEGVRKTGYREIVTAYLDREGRLKRLVIVHPVGTETIERHSSLWRWIG